MSYEQRFQIGARVWHKSYGDGTVIAATLNKNSEWVYSVLFDGYDKPKPVYDETLRVSKVPAPQRAEKAAA